MIMPCMVMNCRYMVGLMKSKRAGNPSCSRITQDSTKPTKPIAIAVSEYCTPMYLASWLKT